MAFTGYSSTSYSIEFINGEATVWDSDLSEVTQCTCSQSVPVTSVKFSLCQTLNTPSIALGYAMTRTVCIKSPCVLSWFQNTANTDDVHTNEVVPSQGQSARPGSQATRPDHRPSSHLLSARQRLSPEERATDAIISPPSTYLRWHGRQMITCSRFSIIFWYYIITYMYILVSTAMGSSFVRSKARSCRGNHFLYNPIVFLLEKSRYWANLFFIPFLRWERTTSRRSHNIDRISKLFYLRVYQLFFPSFETIIHLFT